MGSNYQTTNKNISEIANTLIAGSYTELESTDNKEVCDFLVISHVDKRFFYTKSNNKSHFENLLNILN
ncbi:hypothetical protein [Thalassobellus suaedae]|uniref:Uncharacterized protein n=1 Tax=Thalassobellus suaedae TaxID=3074124 RepID=A0ABY9XVM7_9FLAO|nr:hypothetical protein RHP51_04705 [Flavobacteriaceae bacterium HL-DH14]